MALARVTDTDRGYTALVQRLWAFAHPIVEVGILAGAGADEIAVERGHATSALTLLEVAIFNEFGTTGEDGSVHVPERSFIRGWFDENEAGLRQRLVPLMQDVVRGKRTKEQVLGLLSILCVAQIQARIASGIEPDNADSTIAAKGSSTPLIDTGQLRAGISSRIGER